MVKGSLHAVVSAWEKPKTSENSPPATRNRPRQVQRVVVSALVVVQPEQGADHGSGGERQVHEKRPPPRRV